MFGPVPGMRLACLRALWPALSPPEPPLTPCIPRAGTNYVETLRVQVHANCRIRRIYFAEKLCTGESRELAGGG